MTSNTADDQLLDRAYGAVAVVGVLFAVAAGVFYGVLNGVAVLVGALVALANLWILARSVKKLLAGGQVRWAALAFLKFVALLAGTYALLRFGALSPLALAIGFGALPLGITLAGTLFVPPAPLLKDRDHA
ncbi:MAG TPA: ATP synthase subunit I [Polyangiaceae bacterium]|nr:ATP synthase subunit I [Polyangiaceae bacterium]